MPRNPEAKGDDRIAEEIYKTNHQNSRTVEWPWNKDESLLFRPHILHMQSLDAMQGILIPNAMLVCWQNGWEVTC